MVEQLLREFAVENEIRDEFRSQKFFHLGRNIEPRGQAAPACRRKLHATLFEIETQRDRVAGGVYRESDLEFPAATLCAALGKRADFGRLPTPIRAGPGQRRANQSKRGGFTRAIGHLNERQRMHITTTGFKRELMIGTPKPGSLPTENFYRGHREDAIPSDSLRRPLRLTQKGR
jgi:hypothetical protein